MKAIIIDKCANCPLRIWDSLFGRYTCCKIPNSTIDRPWVIHKDCPLLNVKSVKNAEITEEEAADWLKKERARILEGE